MQTEEPSLYFRCSCCGSPGRSGDVVYGTTDVYLCFSCRSDRRERSGDELIRVKWQRRPTSAIQQQQT